MKVFVNRTLNMKKIKAIGFDMDYTLVRYKTENFEELAHRETVKKLVEVKGYPAQVADMPFQFNRVIQGLCIDKMRGNLLQTNRFGKVKIAYHGTKEIPFKEMQKLYGNEIIDLNDKTIQSLDTNFSVSNGIIYAQLVDLKSEGHELPDYETLAVDIKEAIDICHSDGSIKDKVRDNIDQYIIQDPEVVQLLERFKRFGKKLWVITNSEFHYAKLLLDYTINPFLKEHKHWSELFELTTVLARKPRFFTHDNDYLVIDPETEMMKNLEGPLVPGIYQGGWAGKLEKDFGVEGDEILYLGDHIYGDVLSIKKTFNWRTALILDPLEAEIEAIQNSRPCQKEIDKLMTEKEKLEHKLNTLDLLKHEEPEKVNKEDINKCYMEIDKINSKISELLEEFKSHFNPYWGEMMRAGLEESRIADQVEKYACIYMTKVTDLLEYSPRTYFRPIKRTLAHEIEDTTSL
ncbi:HAD-IG family 5'-nucleotidase [Halobacteriovorax sp. GB3]|uniref:HAD-IG family 5'-nucleotidase n=1 Tax=Halobacteriovorax sp. GB3 TaxID=2719615 RepID=UPI002361F759|nr:HAD-IG family 5'-nucleotidase [Halobacteriovorax sp. GB3]MDD0852009.1 HAD-IG family 5'-nucleotidase [Halobacteriovorax sp. GB3]